MSSSSAGGSPRTAWDAGNGAATAGSSSTQPSTTVSPSTGGGRAAASSSPSTSSGFSTPSSSSWPPSSPPSPQPSTLLTWDSTPLSYPPHLLQTSQPSRNIPLRDPHRSPDSISPPLPLPPRPNPPPTALSTFLVSDPTRTFQSHRLSSTRPTSKILSLLLSSWAGSNVDLLLLLLPVAAFPLKKKPSGSINVSSTSLRESDPRFLDRTKPGCFQLTSSS